MKTVKKVAIVFYIIMQFIFLLLGIAACYISYMKLEGESWALDYSNNCAWAPFFCFAFLVILKETREELFDMLNIDNDNDIIE